MQSIYTVEQQARNTEIMLKRALENPGVPGETEAFDAVSGFTLTQIVIHLRELECDLADAILRRNGIVV